MEKTNAFTDRKTSELFKFMALFLFTMLVVIPPTILTTGIVCNGLINKLNILPLISGLCSISFFKILAKREDRRIIRKTALLLGVTLLFIISVVSFIWFLAH